jgi:hypothetical protein
MPQNMPAGMNASFIMGIRLPFGFFELSNQAVKGKPDSLDYADCAYGQKKRKTRLFCGSEKDHCVGAYGRREERFAYHPNG